MKSIIRTWTASGAFLFLSGCGNPGGVSDEFYEKYKGLAGPKILFSCTDTRRGLPTEVGYRAARSSLTNYNSLLNKAEDECYGEFVILDSEKR